MTTPVPSPMSCEEAVRAAWAYLDDELDAEGASRVRAHLATCDHCRDLFTFEGAFLRTLARLLDEPSETTELRSRILRALSEQGLREPP
jgi:anti-sigma factor (TIGR02949 family)